MSGPLDMGLQLAANAARFGWFYGINQIVDARARASKLRPAYQARRSVPTRQELLGELARLILDDAGAVRDGIYPVQDTGTAALLGHLDRVRAMFQDLPEVLARRGAARADSARTEAGADRGASELPDYYVQDFHFQTGGYLSPQSARLYDVQVETLFYGAANLMRRAALRPLAEAFHGRDQRRLALLDVACGTGRFLRQARLTWPALQLTGLDLSRPYLDEARLHLGNLRPAHWLEANAEAIPLADASQDAVTAMFLFHELPGEVRARVTAEIARVLKPGGLLVFIDSLQIGDRPGWDGLLEAFPVRFHEPYFRQYAIEDLDGMFARAGLAADGQALAFLSKLMVRRKL